MAFPLAASSLVLAAAVGVAVVLQGCGGGGDTTATTTTLTTTTTTLTKHARSPPLSPAEAAKELNKLFMGFNPSDDTSPLGVTLSMAARSTEFTENIFCAEFENTKCFNGQSDCRMSCSLYNLNMINKNYIVDLDFGRPTGYVFNQTMVEKTLGKCAFLFDGASANNFNNGCGRGAPGNDCKTPGNAYDNICPSTKKVCTANDPEVKSAQCKPFGPNSPPKSGKDYQCIYSGPSFNYPEQSYPNHFRDMVKARIETGDTEDHNELILDERLLMPAIWNDPALVIPAFIFSKSSGAAGQKDAEAMSENFSRDYQVARIAVLGVNDVSDYRPNGPFYVPAALEEENVEETVATTVV